jgi:hypothetical protein
MRYSKLIGLLVSLGVLIAPLAAQDDIENMYLRKAVKDFVARDYDNTISDLEQVLTVNPQNEKARKLTAKVYVRKGEEALVQNNTTEASTFFTSAVGFDAANADAQKVLEIVKQRQATQQQAAAARAAEAAEARQQNQAAAIAQQPYAAPAPTIIQTAPAAATFADSAQAKAMENLIGVMNQNQKIIAQQIEQSAQLVNKNDQSKDKYLDALMNASKQGNDRTMRYLMIGGGVAIGFLIIFMTVFFFFFYSVNRSAELRTIQATQSVAALLAAPGASGQGGMPLMLTGPMQQPDGAGVAPVAGQAAPAAAAAAVKVDADIELLNNNDPIKRAQAVEAVEAEIIESKDNVRVEKIKKLGELLNDENNRVRANAAKAIYEVDKEASLSTLSAMIKEIGRAHV